MPQPSLTHPNEGGSRGNTPGDPYVHASIGSLRRHWYGAGVFREARSEDLKAVLRLYGHPTDPVLDDHSATKVFEQIVETAGLHLFVLEHGGAIVATTYLNLVPNLTRSASPYAIIENVVVEETLSGPGPR